MGGGRGAFGAEAAVRLVGAHVAEAVLHALDAACFHEAALAVAVGRCLVAGARGMAAVMGQGEWVVALMVVAATDQIVITMVAVAQPDGAVEADVVRAVLSTNAPAGEFGCSTLDTADDVFSLD